MEDEEAKGVYVPARKLGKSAQQEKDINEAFRKNPRMRLHRAHSAGDRIELCIDLIASHEFVPRVK